MGVYDFFKGPCPKCGAEIGEGMGDIQTKLFSEPIEGGCFRTFRPGDELPAHIEDGLSPLYPFPYCCGSKRVLYAKIENNRFVGFVHGETVEEAKKRIREELGLPSNVTVVLC